MSLNPLPLSYCTNVHAGQTVAEVESGIDRFTVPIRKRLGWPMAAGLWLARPVVAEILASPDGLTRFAENLAGRELSCYTLNAFPYGDFHSTRVKEKVYIPDWSQAERQEYTEQCALVLAKLLPERGEGSISTVPLGFKYVEKSENFLEAATDRLINLAVRLDQLRQESGRTIRLAIEPEPCCVLETTAEALSFFERLHGAADRRGLGKVVQDHLGLCYDVCHQAVEFEDVAASISQIHRAGIRINKLHISCALTLEKPGQNAEARNALRHYVEPRYLHQTFAQLADGRIVQVTDLTGEFLTQPGAEFLEAREWRIHYHVPVNAERMGPLGTTRSALREAIDAVAALDYAPHLEVETYTWSVLPGDHPPDLVRGLAEELDATYRLLADATLRTSA